jgi:hypothetical protein
MTKFLFLILLLVNCNNQPTQSTPTTAVAPAPAEATAAEEQLLGLVLDADSKTVTVTVMSNGCTTKKDFRCSMQNGEWLLERTRRDDCKRMPFATQLQFGFAEAGIDARKPFRVRNRFATVFLN